MRAFVLFVLLLSLVLSPALARAAGVVGNGTPGSCSETALNAALAGDGAVTFSCGGAVTIPITATKTISAPTATDVDGEGLVTLDGQGAVRLFSVDDQRQLALRNLTLRRGRVADSGAAVRSADHERGMQALTIQNVRFEDDACTQAGDDVGGGAVYVQGGVSTIDASTFLRNRGGNGGAIGYLGGDGTGPANGPTVRDSVFVGNATQARVSSLGVTGGALYLDGAGDAEVRIESCTFRDDAAGGAITVAAPASNVTIRASIVVHSRAANGGNPWNTGKSCDVGSPQMTNRGAVIESPQRNLGDGNDENCVAFPVVADPLLGPLADHGGLVETLSLLPESPGEDGAFAGCRAAVDARGAARPAGVRCNVGAFEGTESAVSFFAVTPCRVLDTRLGAGTPVAANGTLSFDAAGTCSVPADARAHAVNVTVVGPGAGTGRGAFSLRTVRLGGERSEAVRADLRSSY